ncbi:multidrug efflux pump subunit AcrA (membrane-fusion protein) [Psychrobacter luti]|uniref:Multidrug efflux pump subunit AcrA (Membrane-fusion protein) n=1 Tax=Psychrobacter luti TaxID=198481 RepID=A0A839TBX4_9GAMM|nr:HlyD family efflux transporter periplasmic adaptor subunit [Psychrobacter luti]MBB3106972.1 multidrug efflux pump subunit AcrA (membrane-fusion protein) [Psychrobacter luti]
MRDSMCSKRLSTIFSSALFLASSPLKKSVYLLSALFIIACQPSPPTSEPVTAENSETVNTPLLIRADSITMTPDHILSVKPTRYQPSLGLEGKIELIKKVNLIAEQALTVEKVLVKKNQWVEKGAPLFIVRRQTTQIQQPADEAAAATNSADTLEANKKTDIKPEQSVANNKDSANDTVTNSNKQTKNDVETDAKMTAANSKKLNTDSAASNGSNDELNNTQEAAQSEKSYNLITVRASFSGRVEKLYIKNEQKVEARQPLLKLSDETELHFIATLPIDAESQISVGQTVNFTAEGLIDEFTGQVSKLTTTQQPKQLLVAVNVVDNEVSRHQIRPDMKVTGRVDYGQIQVGTTVPKRALHNVDLTMLHKPPYKPLRPLIANVWIIKQDQRLTRQPVEVVEYDPLTKQYLIAGITNDSLICLANLPVESEGKKAVVS